MANHLKMAKVSGILLLRERGWSFRRIARELGVHRDTVSRVVREAAAGAKPAKVTLGSEGDVPSKPAKVTLGSPPSRSLCEPFRETIKGKLERGLSAQRIWQDLRDDEGFSGSYSCVKRFVRRLGQGRPVPFRRMECEPGEQAQVDFGTGAPVVGADGRRRKTHAFRIVLSHSRKGYSEAVFRQKTEPFLRALENAFRHFGGVPKVVVIDQLRAAVKHPDWFDPELNPKVESFCRHYGCVILPTQPYTPRHKGKVERGIAYVQDNALKGRTFASLAEENRFLADWEARIADHRIHGTTRQQVKAVFEAVERPALLPLPPDLFPCFQEAQRIVHRDGHVEVARAYYSVPPEYVRATVWVRWDGRLVRVFNRRFEPIAVHPQKEPGRFQTAREHLDSKKISIVEQGADALLRRVARIGPQAARWGHAVLEARGVQGLRVLQGLLSLARKHPATAIERACESALSHQVFRLRGLRGLLKQPTTQAALLDDHPLIRPLRHYGTLVRTSFRPEDEKEEEKIEDAFIASRATGREQRRESPDQARAFPAVRPPVTALGSLASGALSSGPAPATVADSATPRNPEGDPSP
jgi:transposase